jgi:type III pantothenate kinase
MIQHRLAYDPSAPCIALDIGNTRIGMGTWQENEVKTPLAVPVGDTALFNEAFDAQAAACKNGKPAAVVISSVSPPELERVGCLLAGSFPKEPLVIGVSIPLPMGVGVDDPKSVGTDRICAGFAAYERLKTACVVVDFGSATTVDLIDDDGVFLGGAIMAGLTMQFRALHEFTAQLPLVTGRFPPQSYGKNTTEAIQNGVCNGLVGAVRGIVEGYAAFLNRWPHVLATGGDLVTLGPRCDFVDTLVENLTLHGIGLAYQKHLESMGI